MGEGLPWETFVHRFIKKFVPTESQREAGIVMGQIIEVIQQRQELSQKEDRLVEMLTTPES